MNGGNSGQNDGGWNIFPRFYRASWIPCKMELSIDCVFWCYNTLDNDREAYNSSFRRKIFADHFQVRFGAFVTVFWRFFAINLMWFTYLCVFVCLDMLDFLPKDLPQMGQGKFCLCVEECCSL